MILESLNVEELDHITEDTGFFFWGVEGGYHYISTRFFCFRVSKEDMANEEDAWDLREFLESRFGKEPGDGQTIQEIHGQVKVGKHLAKQLVENVFTKFPTTEGIITPYIYAYQSWRYRFAMFEDFNVFANDEFISLIFGATNEKVFAESATSPLYLMNNDFVILPVAVNNGKAELNDFAERVKRNC